MANRLGVDAIAPGVSQHLQKSSQLSVLITLGVLACFDHHPEEVLMRGVNVHVAP